VTRVRAASASELTPRTLARAADRCLDFVVLAFAAWTAVYHVCLVARLGTVPAAVAGGLALLPAAALAFGRRKDREAGAVRALTVPSPLRWRNAGWLALAAMALCATALFAFTSAPWRVVWLVMVLAAATGVALTILRRSAEAEEHEMADAAPLLAWLEAATALAWGIGLAVLSLFLVAPDGDDAYYVHLSSWIAAHGSFPLRDTIFSDEALPAVIYPPLSSFEGLAGTIAGVLHLPLASLVYLVIPAFACVLCTLALWRLLRAWRIPAVALALSVSLLFLLLDAQGHRTLGTFFVSRLWQGKVVFLVVLVPLLLALMADYVARPGRRQVVLLAAAGAAGVGLTSTAVFAVPVVAVACFAPFVINSTRKAVVGLAATVAYPLAAGIGITAAGQQRAAEYTSSDIVAPRLVHFVLGDETLAFVAVAAMLAGGTLIRRRSAAQMTTATVFLVTALFAPPLPLFVFHATGFGRVLWRWLWVIPVAALVGVLATAAMGRVRRQTIALVPAVVVCAVLAAGAAPVWSAADTTVASRPSLKRPAGTIEASRRIVDVAPRDAVVLAPPSLSQTLLTMSGDLTAVAPRRLYTQALRGVPGAHARERLLLLRFSQSGLAPAGGSGASLSRTEVARALDVLGVDVACVGADLPTAGQLLREAGYEAVPAGGGYACFRAAR
jgi:hypothetical protein